MNKTLKTGAVIEIPIADLDVAKRLMRIVANELKQVALDIETVDLTKLMDMDVNSLKNMILQLLGSEAIDTAVMQCMARGTYNGQKITASTFQPEESRSDYLSCVVEVMILNLRPFFSGLDLSSLTPAKPPATPSPS